MRWSLLLVLLLAVPASQAAILDFQPQAAYHALAAQGDIPATDDQEPAGVVNILEFVTFDHDGNETIIQAQADGNAACSCGGFSREGNTYRIGPEVAAGRYVFALQTQAPAGTAWTLTLALAPTHSDTRISIYAPSGYAVEAPIDLSVLPCTGGQACNTHHAQGIALPADLWFAAHPAGQTTVPVGPEPAGVGWLELVLGLLAGAAVWALLVQRGLVQARSRKQVVQAAAHQEVAAEGKDTLEARKRVLMAGLKELEVAKMNKQIDDGVYEVLKSELKREAVTVMRALDATQ